MRIDMQIVHHTAFRAEGGITLCDETSTTSCDRGQYHLLHVLGSQDAPGDQWAVFRCDCAPTPVDVPTEVTALIERFVTEGEEGAITIDPVRD